MKIFVAIPVYNENIVLPTVVSILSEQAAAIESGDELAIRFYTSAAGIVLTRNQIAQDFMESGFDRLVFLDSDVSFERGAILKLAKKTPDLVGGCYRLKIEDEEYPIRWVDGKELWANEENLLEVASLPTGFMAVSRKVFQTIQESCPNKSYTLAGREMYCWFEMPFKEGTFWGEDIYFCKTWADLGGKIYLDPEIPLTHWGTNPKPFPGHIGNHLKSRNEVPAVAQ